MNEHALTVNLRAADPHAAAAARRFAARAAASWHADLAYATLASPLGELLLVASRRGLTIVRYADDGVEAPLAEIAARRSPRIVEAPATLDPWRRELDEYFARRRRQFDEPLDLTPLSGFRRQVLLAASKIPYGAALSYKEIATLAGSPRGARAAGNALGSNPLPIVIPCHRVRHAGGGLGGYTGGLERKRALLAIEAQVCSGAA
jgi:methylated-DNA-[protein]-cysteine S-methyltransferase